MKTDLLKDVYDVLSEIEHELGRSIEFKHSWYVLRDKVRTELSLRGELPDPAMEDWTKELGSADADQIAKALKHISSARRVLDSVYCYAARKNGEEHLRRAANTLTELLP